MARGSETGSGQPPPEAADSKGLEFKVVDHNSQIVVDGVLTTTGKIMQAAWKDKPQQVIRYHKINRSGRL